MPKEVEKQSWPKSTLSSLIQGTLDEETIRQIQRRVKDEDRFEKMLEIEQERVPWKEKILLPLQEHLYVVEKGSEYIIKCFCGYEYGDYRKNWKLNALVYERDPLDEEVYVGQRGCAPVTRLCLRSGRSRGALQAGRISGAQERRKQRHRYRVPGIRAIPARQCGAGGRRLPGSPAGHAFRFRIARPSRHHRCDRSERAKPRHWRAF
jgi:hypothetical protein